MKRRSVFRSLFVAPVVAIGAAVIAKKSTAATTRRLIDAEDTYWSAGGVCTFGVLVFVDDQEIKDAVHVELYSDGTGFAVSGNTFRGWRYVTGNVRIVREQDAAYSDNGLVRYTRNRAASLRKIEREIEHYRSMSIRPGALL